MYRFACYWILYSTILQGSVSGLWFGSEWNSWNEWTSCSQTCGTSHQTRSRTCPHLYVCNGATTQSRLCSTECHVDTPCSQVSPGAYDCNFETTCPNWSTTFAKGSSTPTESTGPDQDHTFQHKGCGNFVYLEATHKSSGQLLSNKMTTNSYSCLSFFVNFHSKNAYDMGTLDVSVKPSAGENVLLWERDGSYFSRYKEWLPVKVNIPAGTNFQIQLVGEKQHAHKSDLAIDDIRFTPNQRCANSVDGNWSPWTSYGECSATCGCGTKTRRRYCDTPERTDDGANCMGPKDEVIPCDEELPACPVKGNWADWGPWSKCTQECGIEYQSRTQECSDPIPVGEDEENKCMIVNDDGEMDYALSRMQSRLCNHIECGLNVWSAWSQWSECSTKCARDKGTKVKTRTCPDEDNVSCVPENEDNVFGNVEIVQQQCYGDDRCDSSWGDWLSWSECSITCSDDELDVGTRYKSRTKYLNEPNHLEDSYRKVNTLDEPLETETTSEVCNSTVLCNRGWSSWYAWSECSGSCNQKCGGRMGTQTRRRVCERSTNDCTPNDIYNYIDQSEIETKTCLGDDSCVNHGGHWDISRNTEIGVIPFMSPTWSVSVDIKLMSTTTASSNTNIIRLGYGPNNGIPGDRFVLILVRKDELRLNIQTTINNVKNYNKVVDALQLSTNVNIEQRQDYHEDEGKYYYKILVDCKLVHQVENENATTFENLTMYASDNYYDSANVKIRSFIVDPDTTEPKHLIQRNYALMKIPTLARQWVLEFDLKSYAVNTLWSNVLIATGNNEDNNTAPEFKIPGLAFKTNSLTPIFYNYMSGTANKNYPQTDSFELHRWYTIRMEQVDLGANYVFRVFIDDVQVVSDIQTDPQEFTDVELRGTGRIGRSAYAYIRNYRFENLVEPDGNDFSIP